MKSFSVVIKKDDHEQLFKHLIREDEQEDLCFATYVPSNGENRFSGIISKLIIPEEGDRDVHGNVGFMPSYFERVLSIANKNKEGIAFLHSHPWPGWQRMSEDDITAEERMSPAVMASTSLPLLGLTMGNDGAWSGRYWLKDNEAKRKYNRHWCETVRVQGIGVDITFNENILPPKFDRGKQLRTISAWGEASQEDLSRIRIGIVGLGSVGSMVAEILSRTGISNFTLIDFDIVEDKNLDRLMNVFEDDIGKRKVDVISKAIKKSATSPNVEVKRVEYSVCEERGFKAALDSDIIFSCVDRPWPREVLNFISYAHLIPVIDGGILVRTNKKNSKIVGADWKAHTIGYGRVCLECLGQYKTENSALERSGLLDDPSYMKNMPNASILKAHENVFVFSSHLASLEVLQMLSLILSPSGINDIGQQLQHFVTGTMENITSQSCQPECMFPQILGKGDYSGITPYGQHAIAERIRNESQSLD